MVVCVGAAILAPAGACAVPRPVSVCTALGGQAGPEIDGAFAVWTDNRNGNLDIYGRNLSARTNVTVCRDPAQQDNPSVTRFVAADGKVHYLVVWVDKRYQTANEGSDILGRDVTEGTDFIVARSPSTKWFPEIVDQWVVWMEADNLAGPYSVMARDLTGDVTYTVATTQTLSPIGLDRRTVDGRKVYTVVYASGNGDISGCDLPSGVPFAVSRRTRFEWMPDISGDRVVWWENGGRVVTKDLRSGVRRFVRYGARPRISGSIVVCDGGGHGGAFTISYNEGARIHVTNVSTGFRTVVSQKGRTCLFPVISGDRVVWEAGPALRVLTGIHIYGARL